MRHIPKPKQFKQSWKATLGPRKPTFLFGKEGRTPSKWKANEVMSPYCHGHGPVSGLGKEMRLSLVPTLFPFETKPET